MKNSTLSEATDCTLSQVPELQFIYGMGMTKIYLEGF